MCRRLRTRGIDTPILLLTGRNGLADRVRGLDVGADDYLAKPFAFEELLARLRAVTRRGRLHHLAATLACGPIELDQQTRHLSVDKQAVLLSNTEFRLLQYLMLCYAAVFPDLLSGSQVMGTARGSMALAAGVIGTTNSSTPALKEAVTLSAFAPSGNGINR